MTGPGPALPGPYDDALLAARLCAIDPGLGGLALRGGGELRDTVIAELRAYLPADAPLRRIPLHVDDERLLGGLDLTATLARGAAVTRAGLLQEAHGGVIVLALAERISDATAGRIAASIDGGPRFVTVLLDDGVAMEERPPASLAERLAFWIDLSAARGMNAVRADLVEAQRLTLVNTNGGQSSDTLRTNGCGILEVDPEILAALVATAAALGIDSARAPLFALRTAQAAATLAGRTSVADEDVALAARLVLAPRATQLPGAADEAAAEPPSPSEPRDDDSDERDGSGPLEDIVLAAALAALPRDLLARLASSAGRRGPVTRARGAGERRKSAARGRPLGARAGLPRGGARLSLIDTLRAAAPWQALRGRDDRIQIRRDDLRVRRYETRAEAVTIFAVDASGSSALARLAEAKGAVELLLAEAYIKRAQVALVAFRGTNADLLLPPTRSLTRARRALAELPGGGGTPLAAGLNAARDLAEAARARGRTPFVVVLTDGRANIAADGSAVRSRAEADATAAAKAIGSARIASAFVDISARPRPEGAALAAAMGAHYLPLPRADAATMQAAVRAARRE